VNERRSRIAAIVGLLSALGALTCATITFVRLYRGLGQALGLGAVLALLESPPLVIAGLAFAVSGLVTVMLLTWPRRPGSQPRRHA